MNHNAALNPRRRRNAVRRYSSILFCSLLLFSILAAGRERCAAAGPVGDEDAYLLDRLWDGYQSHSGIQRPKVGLALGGGGSRGLAHIGILKVFEQERIPVDAIAGASVGALIGALYAAGVTSTKLETMARDVGWESLTNFSRLSMVRLVMAHRLLSSERMETYLQDHIGDRRFYELERPFACVATDLQTGERVIFREGPVALAARASATIPGLFEPVVFRHRYLVDGGLVGNVPVDLARSLGAEHVVAVDVSSDFSRFEPKNVLSTMSQAIFIQGVRLSEPMIRDADILIRPYMADISPIDLTRSAECIDAGVVSAWQAMPRVKRLLMEPFGLSLLSARAG